MTPSNTLSQQELEAIRQRADAALLGYTAYPEEVQDVARDVLSLLALVETLEEDLHGCEQEKALEEAGRRGAELEEPA